MSRFPAAARAVATVALTVVLAACSGGDAGSDGDAPPSPSGTAGEAATDPAPTPPPPAGACYDLDFDQATSASVDADPVPCTQPHTALTVAVLDGVDPDDTSATARACTRRVHRFLGGDRQTRRLSRFTPVWFTPTADDVAAGARWVRCDVVAVAGSQTLAELPGGPMTRGVLDRPRARSFALCATAAPGTDAFERVVCARPHRWRALTTLAVPSGPRGAFPGQRAARDAGVDRCRQAARAAVRADRVRFGWEWPTAEQWEAGQRYGYCWVPRRN